MKTKRRSRNYTAAIALSFLIVIMLGTVLLCLPVSSRNGTFTNPADAFFTSVSATCVTGLVVFDTATHWTVFGQIIILCMIQIGGLGFMSVAALLTMMVRRNLSASQRMILMQSAGSVQMDGIRAMIKRIFIGTAIFEILGAAALSVRFVPLFGAAKGIYFSVFHAVSAFCNAGFDIMGANYGKFSSFTAFYNDRLVCTVLMVLIITGGIGHLVWRDASHFGFRFKKYSVHSKVTLTATAGLLISGFALYSLLEWNSSLAGLDIHDKLFSAMFQSVTTRTAGFNTINQGDLSNGGIMVSLLFMLTGGSPGSTAGGIKTTTMVVIALNAIAIARRRKDVIIFKKRLDDELVRQACSVFTVYMGLMFISSVIICAVDGAPIRDVLFETASALGTVGLTTGITPGLSTASHMVLAFMMYLGRIGGFSLIMLIIGRNRGTEIGRPAAKILIG